MTTTQLQLQAAAALFDAAHKRYNAALKEVSAARVMLRLAPNREWSFTEQASWLQKHQDRYDLAVLAEARAEAAYERARDRLETAQRADNAAQAVEPAGAGGLEDYVERARR